MKLPVLDAKKAKKGEMALPKQFAEPVREDLIKRAVHALQAAARQPYGTDPEAGKRSSAELSRRRRKYRGSYGKGISRVPRKILNRRGSQMYMVGAFAPGTVGGRRAHPPKASKVWTQKVNKRENRKAIRSALAAVMEKALVAKRGHKVPAEYPFLLDSSCESFAKTREVERALIALGFAADLDRAMAPKTRGGKAKLRGRKTRRATSLLLVTGAEDAPLLKSASNIPGVTVSPVNALNASLLAPGTHPGRATLFTQQAIERLEKEGLFLDTGKKPQTSKTAHGERSAADGAAAKAPVKTAAKPAAKKTEPKSPAKNPVSESAKPATQNPEPRAPHTAKAGESA